MTCGIVWWGCAALCGLGMLVAGSASINGFPLNKRQARIFGAASGACSPTRI